MNYDKAVIIENSRFCLKNECIRKFPHYIKKKQKSLKKCL